MDRGTPLVMSLDDVGLADVGIVGGKAAHLGSLSKLELLKVPAGFCVTTHAFQRIVAQLPLIEEPLERLLHVKPEDLRPIRALSAAIREAIVDAAIPDDIAGAIEGALRRLGEECAYAVRSSGTAEDLPSASFAGQQDTYLNVIGPAAILAHVRRCWASLFTERAVSYRQRFGFDHRKVQMAVLVQQMVAAQASGILFTADPATGNRQLASVEASFGLGEALVSGLVDADRYKVRGDQVISKTIGSKQLAIHAAAGSGTSQPSVEPERREPPALTDRQVVRLVQLGRRIEAHFGRPQDIEWCLVDDQLEIVQSRPITTLFPTPTVGDGENRVYVSVGHQQMMTDAMKPLGLSFWQLTTPRPMSEAGGRLFVDVTRSLASPASRASLMAVFAKHDPRITDALQAIVDRGDFVRSLPDDAPTAVLAGAATAAIETDPTIVSELIARGQASVARLKREIRTKTGTALLDFILADIQELKGLLFDRRGHQVFMSAIDATFWLNQQLEEWLSEKNVADVLTQSAPNNITSEMGLALLDVADAIRPHPEVVAFLEHVVDEGFLDALPHVRGGREAGDAIVRWLDTYGMRCAGEIDITRPRWSERPIALVPLILGNVKNFEPDERERRFEQGKQEASQKERELLERLRALPDGQWKAEETKRMIERVRTFIGYREYPKYGMVSRYLVYKQALLEEAERFVQASVLGEKEDIFYLRFEEVQDMVRTNQVDERLVRQRKDAFRSYQALRVPRVLLSNGEVMNGAYQREGVPDGSLVGLAVSAGTIEGRARVILDMVEADLEAGDILVTAYTDPSWTPLFVAIKGLVTEVGGLMTHGAVIAREYGLPAVVGVDNATSLIRDGQRIRVHGTDGYVELLPT
jgi:phosphoenolpyruvate synthase/pyruvate phosphate dikinase